ncbi:serine/threonine-protein kinase HipA [Kribbella sp. VKM Ac-2571]|uniref:type II toxin-antitoxin system HipA family toxin n=1 Tax=Kribbella sp. VKM Ac-2571 TaxID=2512222 RepID=UPI00105E363C|nr:HipA domain-containing protein [Kribbella sp. VKM Ac-2571]TDO68673.1 serine/threonine-protein kinase HipA [Kribbella sp. VKM Ac-2571]
MSDPVFVSVEIGGETVEVGTAYFTRRNAVVSTSFRYAEDYLARPGAYAIDPGMPLLKGNYALAGLPGAFTDCSPDRWGKNLISKTVRAKALRDGRTAPSVGDVDYLLGVSDLTRQGALRFRQQPEGQFLHPGLTVPKLIELPRLLRAADGVARDSDDMSAIKDLLDAGSGSLGGARPKASVRDGERLLIAKFPHHSDEWDVMAWEKTALDLAERAGIEAPRRETTSVNGKTVLLLDRFDRNGSHRVGYMSAMTMVQGRDGGPGEYLEVAETLSEFSSRTSDDLQQLWRRIAFSIAIHNTDDHLRNHGFLRDGPAGWRLSPVFDVNPNPDAGVQRVTGIGGAYRREDELEGLMTYAESFRVTPKDARQIIRDVLHSTVDWQRVATSNGIPKSELSRFEDAFEGLRKPLKELVR